MPTVTAWRCEMSYGGGRLRSGGGQLAAALIQSWYMMLPDEAAAVTWTWAPGECVAATAISEADMAAPAAPSARMAEMMITRRTRMIPPTNLAGQLLGLPRPADLHGCASM